MNIYDPKARFLSYNELTAPHRARCVDHSFIAALDAALLVYTGTLTKDENTKKSVATANHYKMAGAREFVKVLLNLAEKPDLPIRAKPPSLDHSV